jgi:hypothetical protein
MELTWAIQTIDVLVDMRGSARKKEAWQAIKAALQSRRAVANGPTTAAATPCQHGSDNVKLHYQCKYCGSGLRINSEARRASAANVVTESFNALE